MENISDVDGIAKSESMMQLPLEWPWLKQTLYFADE